MRYLPLVVAFGLLVYAAIDVVRSEPDERNGLPRAAWLVIVLLPVVGPVVWLVARQQARARGAGGAPRGGSGGSGGGGGGGGGRPKPSGPGPRRPSGPVAPDDDPEFLWRLEQMQRRAEKERSAGGATPGADGPTQEPAPGSTDAEGDTPGHGPGPRTSP